MSENMKENESEPSFPNQSQEAAPLKLEMATTDSGEQPNNDAGGFAGKAYLPKIKESAARIRFRLCRGRKIF